MSKSLHTHGGTTPRRRRSPEVARKEILDAAQRRLAEGGPDAIRLQDIAADVGISHPTILHHFGSRSGLLVALDDRAIRALTDDVQAMMRGAVDLSSGVDLVERLAETMNQQGLARLIAFWAMRGGSAQAPGDVDPAGLVEEVSKLIAARLSETAGAAPNNTEFVSFSVRLAVSAMLGDALIGDIMSPVSGEERDEERPRFRHWLLKVLLTARSASQASDLDA